MKIRFMFHTCVTLMATLMLNIPLLSLVEQHYTTEDAIADAIRDAEQDISKLSYFTGGLGLACAGAGSLVVFEGRLGLIGAVLLPIAGLGSIYSSPSSPPVERLIGKSPEYVSVYTDAYISKARSIQTTSAALGCVTGYGTLIAIGVTGCIIYLKDSDFSISPFL